MGEKERKRDERLATNNMSTPEKTPEVKDNLQERLQGFNNDLKPILEKWELGLGGEPFITPDGRIGARSIATDAKKTEDQKPEVNEA